MKQILCLITVFILTAEVIHAAPPAVTHFHEGRVHKHVLPNNGIGKHQHNKTGKHNKKTPNNIIKSIFAKAANGDSKAQLESGDIFWNVKGSNAKAKKIAIDYYRRSAISGNVSAQEKLGFIYLDGIPNVVKKIAKKLLNGF